MFFNSKKIIIALILVAVVLGGYLTYSYKPGPETSNIKYKLAALLPETGNLAFIGQPMKNALTLAHEQMQAKLAQANIQIDLIFADTQGNPREAVTQFTRVADVEKVNGIVTTLSGIVSATAPIGKDRDILFIGLTVDPSFLNTNPNALRVYFSFDQEGKLLADLIKKRGWKKVLILHSTDSATTYEVIRVLAPILKEDGISATLDTFTVGQRDFKNLCAKYAGEKWDGVIYHGFGSELPFLAETCSAFPNISGPPKLSPLSTLDVKPELRNTMIGIQFFAPAFLANETTQFDEFSKRYESRFPGMELAYSAVYAYDAYILLAEALLRRPTLKASLLKEEMQTPIKALTQEYQFDSKGDFRPDTIFLEITSAGIFSPVRTPEK